MTVTSKVVTFNSPYGDLPMPQNRSGCTFIGWFSENNGNVTSETIVTTPNDHTLYARWKETPTKFVEIFFTKDMSNKEIEVFVEEYVNEKYELMKMEGEDNGTRVVVEFGDAVKAEDFVEAVKAVSNTSTLVKSIKMVSIEVKSFSALLCPIMVFGLFMT